MMQEQAQIPYRHRSEKKDMKMECGKLDIRIYLKKIKVKEKRQS